MTPERWQQVERLYQAALVREPSQRAAFLEEACAGDEELRREAESLLAYEPQAESFIEAPALEAAAKTLPGDQAQFLVGRQIGSYKVLSLLGTGGMGEVYRAQDSRLDREITLKILPAGVASDRDRLRRFIREAKAASALNHPNVATIHEIGESDGIHFIAMEYVKGQTLAAKVSGRPLDPTAIVEIGIQIADALDEAHAKGITHRDIKPANIMLTPRGQVKVLDFGLAKVSRPESQAVTSDTNTVAKTEIGVVMGTVRYMSPEQVLGREVDHRTDIFSLGVVLYEMATGRLPFSGPSATEMMDRILHAQPEAIADFNRDAPAELERIVRKCLEKDRERRYQSTHELLIDLSHLKRGIDSGVATAGGEYHEKWRKPLTARRLLASAALVLLVVPVLVYLLLFRGAPTPSPSDIKSLAILPFKPLNLEVRNDYLELGIADTLITKVSQVRGLTVRPLSAIRKYASPEGDTLKAAQELKVDAVLDGAVQRDGERLRISVNLLRIRDGTSLWADTFNVRFTDIFAVQDEVARQVAAQLRFKLSTEERARLARQTTASPEAYEYYLKGMGYLDRGRSGGADVQPAIVLFKNAIEVDPNFARAYAQLARAYASMALFNEPDNPVWLERVKQALSQAQTLDPNLSEVHVVRARLLRGAHEGYRNEEAIRELLRAQELNPSVGHDELGILYAHLGLEEQSLRELQRALDIDPTNEASQNWLVEAHQMLGRYDEAIALHPRFSSRSAHTRCDALLAKHRLDEAQPLIEAALTTGPQVPYNRGLWALLLTLRGRFREAEAEIPKIEAGQKDLSYHHACHDMADVYALQGKTRQVVEWLRKAAETGLPNYLLFSRDPHLDRIRRDPVFVQFMAELKMRWESYRREFP
jgi:serine/threonine protein kinase/tetratricopeptide (TPR) repeat protein